MALTELIDRDIKQALLSRDGVKLRGLRAVKAALLIAKSEKGSEEMSIDQELKLLQKLVKQRKESKEIFTVQHRPDLALLEQEEIEVISFYLPTPLSEQEVETQLIQLIKEHGLKKSDIGKIMGIATKHFGGQVEGKLVAELGKRILTNQL